MSKRASILQVIAAATILAPVVLHANPIAETRSFRDHYALLISIPLLLLLEGCVLGCLCKVSRQFFARFVYLWLAITSITFTLLMWGVDYVKDGDYLDYVPFPFAGGLLIAVGETAVALAEAIALYYLLRAPGIREHVKAPVPAWKCLLFSVIANCCSFAGGIMAGQATFF